MKFQEKLQIDTPYRPKHYFMGRPSRYSDGRYFVKRWYGCREIWHWELKESAFFFYTHEQALGENIASFMWRIEESLDIPLSNIGPTNRRTIMWVEPSQWWIDRSMRRSLFTLFLRAGKYYDPQKDNFQEALYGDEYICLTYYAVSRFLDGYTRYVGNVNGWFHQFFERSPSGDEVDRLLQKPKTKNA